MTPAGPSDAEKKVVAVFLYVFGIASQPPFFRKYIYIFFKSGFLSLFVLENPLSLNESFLAISFTYLIPFKFLDATV